LHHFLVSDAQKAQAASCQDAVTLGIVVGLFGLIVYWPIDLHHQPNGVTIKVNNEAIDDLLATEMETIQLVAP